jgi:hypothetical protein
LQVIAARDDRPKRSFRTAREQERNKQNKKTALHQNLCRHPHHDSCHIQLFGFGAAFAIAEARSALRYQSVTPSRKLLPLGIVGFAILRQPALGVSLAHHPT